MLDERILDEAPCGFMVINQNSEVLYCNHTLKKWLGLQPEKPLPADYRFYDMLTIGSKMYCETHFFPRLQYKEQIQEINLELLPESRKNLPVLVSAKLLQEESNQKKYLCTLIDISHRKLYERELMLAKKKSELHVKELHEINEGLTQFSHTVAHDLKSPLRNVQGLLRLVEQMEKESLSAEALGYLKKAVTRSEEMSRLIDELLEFAASGSQHSPHETVSFQHLLNTLMEKLSVLIQEQAASLLFPEQEYLLHGNFSELLRLFQNLVENAMKYKQRNTTPEISIEVKEEPDGLLISVKDNGIGIPESYLDTVFSPFVRAHRDSSSEKGTGIGLATCKKIVDSHQGDIRVVSAVGKGSTFFIRLPTPSTV